VVREGEGFLQLTAPDPKKKRRPGVAFSLPLFTALKQAYNGAVERYKSYEPYTSFRGSGSAAGRLGNRLADRGAAGLPRRCATHRRAARTRRGTDRDPDARPPG